MNNPQIESLEEKAIALADNLRAFHRDVDSKGGHYGDNYNHLGTLKVNLLSLIRAAQAAADAIKINV